MAVIVICIPVIENPFLWNQKRMDKISMVAKSYEWFVSFFFF